jgi:hypothetical protein
MDSAGFPGSGRKSASADTSDAANSLQKLTDNESEEWEGKLVEEIRKAEELLEPCMSSMQDLLECGENDELCKARFEKVTHCMSPALFPQSFTNWETQCKNKPFTRESAGSSSDPCRRLLDSLIAKAANYFSSLDKMEEKCERQHKIFSDCLTRVEKKNGDLSECAEQEAELMSCVAEHVCSREVATSNRCLSQRGADFRACMPSTVAAIRCPALALYVSGMVSGLEGTPEMESGENEELGPDTWARESSPDDDDDEDAEDDDSDPYNDRDD